MVEDLAAFTATFATTFFATGLALVVTAFAFGVAFTVEDLIAFPLVSANFALATGFTFVAASFFEALAGAAVTFFVAMRTFRSF